MVDPYTLLMKRSEIDDDEFSETELAILDMLAEGRCTPSYIAAEIDKSQPYIRDRLSDLKRLGLVDTVHRGLYELAEDVAEGE